MSAGVARLIFVFALVLNLLLWSNSRYAHKVVSQSVRARDHGGLVRRISYELTHPGEVRMLEDMVCSHMSFLYHLTIDDRRLISAILHPNRLSCSANMWKKNVPLHPHFSQSVTYIPTSAQSRSYDHWSSSA